MPAISPRVVGARRPRAHRGAGQGAVIPLAELHRLPGDTPAVETQLGSGELIVSIDLPTGPATRRSHYLKVRDRASFEW